MTSRRALGVVAFVVAAGAQAAPARAHTDSDFVAVPAGEVAELTLKPTHGCGDSRTIAVATRVPVEGAQPVEVPGWAASSTPDGEGRTVIEWTGGTLPSDEVGAFPISFLAPDTSGELLTFPFIQRCANGEELAWISGDPASEFPAPRILILPPGFEPAPTIDDVPADAPGRDQLAAIVDVDDPSPDATTSTTRPSTTTTPTTTPTTEDEVLAAPPSDTDDDSLPVATVGVAAALAAAIAVGALVAKRRGVTP